MDTEKSDMVLEATEAPPQEETGMEKVVSPQESTELQKPQAADEEPKQMAVNGHDKGGVNVKETEEVMVTERKTDTEDSSGKDQSETETVLGAVAPQPEPDESSGKISHPVSALDTEPKNIQPEQQPMSKNDPEPLPMKTPLAESTPEPEPEKQAESVPQAEIQEETLPEPAKPVQPVNTQPPSQEEKVPGQVETQAVLQTTMDKGAEEVAKEGETKNADTSESMKKDGEEKPVAETVTSKEDESAKSDAEPKKEEDTSPLPGSLSFSILEQKQTKDALLTSRTLIVLRGLPGSGKSFLAHAINDAYKDLCTVISADDHGVKPENPESSAEGYKALDEAVMACCSAGPASSVLIVVDDTNHTQDRLARLEEIAEEHNLVAVFLEPQTGWSRDPAQLTKKTKRGLDEALLKTMKGPLEEVTLPLFFGWFLLSSVQEKIRCTSMDFLKTLDTLEAFKKHMSDFTGKPDKEVDLEQYFEAKGTLHCTTKFCNYGKAEGAKEYAEKPAVKNFYGSIFELSLTALFVTPRVVGARVTLSEEQLVLWPDDAEKEAESAVPTAASLPLGSRAHITLGCAEGVEPVQTGLDLLQILALQQEGQQGELVTEMELGSLRYYGEGRWLLSLREPMCAPACFSSFYNRTEVEPTKKEAEKKKKPKCTIL
ncbi:2',3'-cyclic-nucleotide 3'-phosphodiesterase [Channa argus]|uniref:2',3'-cyclic-nucleotide 3'-phosphodiesterase n=1 Tax=Channa argus TaxID=215402 RepID=A0A6G1QCC5_CHAAH|nr:2',3'-cyclic-nucleotide 3'-phosphodiesterase [Channa argus]